MYTLKLIKIYTGNHVFQFFLTNSRHFLQICTRFEGSIGLPGRNNLLLKLRADPFQGAKFLYCSSIDMDRQSHFWCRFSHFGMFFVKILPDGVSIGVNF